MSNLNPDPRSAMRKTMRRRLLIAAIVTVPLLVAIVLLPYGIDWARERADHPAGNSSDFLKAYQTFLDDLDADRIDAAYRSTTIDFQRRVSPEQFAETSRRYLAFKRKPDARGIEAESRDSTGGDHTGPSRMVFIHTLEDQAGAQQRAEATLEQEDNILDRRARPPRIAEFKVSEIPKSADNRPPRANQ